MAEPTPYKLKIEIECSDPDKLNDVLTAIDMQAKAYDSTPSTMKAVVSFEGFSETPLLAIRNAAEDYLRGRQWEMLGKVTLTQPLQRSPVIKVSVVRPQATMDDILTITGNEPEEPSYRRPPPPDEDGTGYDDHPDDTDY